MIEVEALRKEYDELVAVDDVSFVARPGVCVLYTTHYMEEAEALCDRLAILDHGRIIASGTLEELRGSMGERDLVRLAGTLDPAAVRKAVGSLDGVEIVAAADDQVALAVPEASRRLPEILNTVAGTGAAGGGGDGTPAPLGGPLLPPPPQGAP